jgi:hypothetical protein
LSGLLAAVALVAAGAAPAGAAKAGAAKAPAYKVADCYGCHDTIEKLHAKNRHATVGCENCHEGLDKHQIGRAHV